MKRPLRRFDIKNILADPEQRRMMVARSTVATQAREGIDITLEEALESYDRIIKDKQNEN
jgi:hypothetical protein